jgi:uncharacterized protein (DUF2147 family)
MKSKLIFCFALVRFITLKLEAQTMADDIIGVWLTPGKEPAKIQIYKSGEKYNGKIVWLKYSEVNGKPRVDNNNPNRDKRNQLIIGLIILTGFRFDSDAEWESGKIYDPESGKTYSCYLSLKDKNTLKVRGYLGVSLFGRTEMWARTGL